MKFKKAVLGVAAVATAMLLAACGDKTIATINGGQKITESEYYSSLKSTASGKQVLSTMIINNALDAQFGKKVSAKDVNAEFNTYKKQYGSQFSQQLAASGLTAASLKENIRTQKLLNFAMQQYSPVSKSQLEKQFKAYQPKVTVRYILLKNNDDGKKQAAQVISDLNSAKGDKQAEFIKLAKKFSTDPSTANNGGLYTPFDNTDTNTDPAFKAAAFKLKKGEYTKEAVFSKQFGYFVIFMKSDNDKPSTITPAIKKILEKQLTTANLNDQTKVSAVIKKVIQKADPQIKDNDLKDVLQAYLNPNSAAAQQQQGPANPVGN